MSRMQKGVRYNKNAKVWVRKMEGKFEYFDINQWQYMEYAGDTGPEHFCSEADFDQKWVRLQFGLICQFTSIEFVYVFVFHLASL